MPAVMFLSYGVMRLTGSALPEWRIPLSMIPVFFVVFFIAAIGKEAG
ncbi:hypothetical protein B4135_4218 [Caldibacillus debilis]|uniref:Uncharacterized protein n=1 Tax=Caldibacillus debilis TaxID=301148 RepID=A0A150L6W4_9BACI|nr:hypothetical protein B4135_4218 [Caldibacillus debilis]